MMRGTRHTICTFMLALLAGCSPVGPEFVKPEVTLPSEWSETGENGLEIFAPADSAAEIWRALTDAGECREEGE